MSSKHARSVKVPKGGNTKGHADASLEHHLRKSNCTARSLNRGIGSSRGFKFANDATSLHPMWYTIYEVSGAYVFTEPLSAYLDPWQSSRLLRHSKQGSTLKR